MEQITIKEIASLCGVGVSTVSRAINNHPDINPETKERILRTIEEHHYIPNNSARNLKRSEARAIAVLVRGISNPFFGSVFQILEREIVRSGYSFTLQQVEESEDEIETAIRLEKEKRLQGIIFLGGRLYHSPERFDHLTVPYVICTVDMQVPENADNCAVVSIDDEKESCRMVEYLIGRGHRRIAVLVSSEEDGSIGGSRMRGYRRALEKNGLPYDPALVRTYPSGRVYTMESGYEMTRELIESGTEFTCVYAVSDTMAIGACRALLDKGIRVPEDVSVAGFDGLEMARYYNPVLTTMAQPRREMAEEAVRLLFDLIRERSVPGHVLFEASLEEGASVADVK